MLKSITIKNFKAIGENELTLNNLANVNYLVGPNGCGKSSVLEILLQTSLINEQNTELKYKEYTSPLGFFHGIDRDLLRKLQVENLEINLISELKIDSKTVKYKIRNQKFELIGAFKTAILNFNSLINGEKPYGLLSSILKPNKNNIRAYIDGMGPGTIAMGLPICSEERWKNYSILSINYQEEYYTNLFSYGQSYFHSVCYLLRSIFTQQLANKKNIEMICIFEEPEKYLHPEYQKLIPLVFDSILNDFPNVKFIISTHSPFIISAAGEISDSQKVYLINGGETVDIYGNKNSIESREG